MFCTFRLRNRKRKIPEINTNVNNFNNKTVLIDITACERGQLERCDSFIGDIASTNLFQKIITKVDKNTKFDYFVKLNHKEPLYSRCTMGHFGGTLILSIILPLWETRKYGYDFTIYDINMKQIAHINTIVEKTTLYWSVAILINILPNFGLNNEQNEILHLKNTIINEMQKINI